MVIGTFGVPERMNTKREFTAALACLAYRLKDIWQKV